MEECAWVASLNCSSSCSVDQSLTPLCIYASLVEIITAAWRVLSTILVLCMQPGFALLEAGACREKHRETVLSKNIMDMMFSPVLFTFWIYLFNDALASASDGSGNRRIKGEDVFFHSLFCATAVTICSGAVAERMTITAYLINAVVISIVIYPILATSAWTREGAFSDWLTAGGHRFHDWAGSGVVHLTGAACAVQGNLFMGPRSWYHDDFPGRLGRFDLKPPRMATPTRAVQDSFGDARIAEFTATNVQKQITGTFILLVGWIAFNCGSLRMDSAGKDIVGKIALNTLLAGISAGSVGFVLIKFQACRRDNMKIMPMGVICNSCVTGLVAITAGCDVAAPFQAVYLGALAAAVYPAAASLAQRLGIDDPVNAIAVHGAGGALGLLFPGFVFAMDCGLLVQHESVTSDELCLGRPGYSDWQQLGVQALGLIIIFGWASLISALVWLGLTILECARALKLEAWQEAMQEVISELRGSPAPRSAPEPVLAGRCWRKCDEKLSKEQISTDLKDLIKQKPSWLIEELESELENFWDEHDFATQCAAWHWKCRGHRPFKLLSRCLCVHRIPPSAYIALPRLRISPSKERDGLETFLGDGLLSSCRRETDRRDVGVGLTFDTDRRLKEAKCWVIIGASAEGLALALRLAFKTKQLRLQPQNRLEKPAIYIFDWRVSPQDPADSESPFHFDTEDGSGPGRKDRVVQLEQAFLSHMEQEEIWRRDGRWRSAFSGGRVIWPGRRSFLLSDIEDLLLERVQAEDVKRYITVERLPAHVCNAMLPSERNRGEDSAGTLKNWLQDLSPRPDVLVAADGPSSIVRQSHRQHFPWDPLGEDYVMSVAQQDTSILQAQEWNVVLSLAQQRYFFDACISKGQLFTRLTETEFASACSQVSPSTSGARPPAPGEPVKLSLLTAPSWMGTTVGDGRQLFGISNYSSEVVLQKLQLGCATRHFCKTPGNDGRFVCLIGDAAFQQHPWPGRGFQAGLRAASFLADSWQGSVARNFDQGLEVFDQNMCALRDELRPRSEDWLHGTGLDNTEEELNESQERRARESFSQNVGRWVSFCMEESQWTERRDLNLDTMRSEQTTRIAPQLERLSKEAFKHFKASTPSVPGAAGGNRRGWPRPPW